MTALDFVVHPHPAPLPDADREAVLASPGFGTTFTDHMAQATWTPESGWHDGRVVPYGPLQLDPAAAVLHYAQEVFEGLKAYRHADGSIWTFRGEANARRLQASCRRLALPEVSTEDFLASLRALIAVDGRWVPTAGESGEATLYLRPFLFASEAFLGVRPAKHVTYLVIASPAGAYFRGGVAPVSLWLSREYTRSAPGGTGAAKCGGNYASSLAAQVEASQHGCDQVVFLDAVESRWIEELGGMNIFFVYRDGTIVTPELTGTILEGVTRASLLELAEGFGHRVVERRVDIDEWREGAASGEIAEVFACGTAAVITPVGRLAWDGGEVTVGESGAAGEATLRLRRALMDIQFGRIEDSRGWLTRLG